MKTFDKKILRVTARFHTITRHEGAGWGRCQLYLSWTSTLDRSGWSPPLTLTTFGTALEKVINFERLFRLKGMFNRVIFAAETRQGPRNQLNGSPPNGVIHIDNPNINFHKIHRTPHTTQCVLVSHPVPHEQTVNADCYKFFLYYHICRTVTRPEILYTAISLHDNATFRLVDTL
jgi:hypothetical protein